MGNEGGITVLNGSDSAHVMFCGFWLTLDLADNIFEAWRSVYTNSEQKEQIMTVLREGHRTWEVAQLVGKK